MEIKKRIARAGPRPTSRSPGTRSSSGGFAVKDTLHPTDRLGLDPEGDTAAVTAQVEEIYATILAEETPFLTTDLATAEMVKASANAFLATKISFINAISECARRPVPTFPSSLTRSGTTSASDANSQCGDWVSAAGAYRRTSARSWPARASSVRRPRLTFLREVDSINMRRRARMVELATTPAAEAFSARTSPSSGVRSSRRATTSAIHRRSTSPVNSAAGCGRHRLRPQGDGQLAQTLPDPGYSTRSRTPANSPTRCWSRRSGRSFVELKPADLEPVVRKKGHRRRTTLPRPGGVDPRRLGVPRPGRHTPRRLISSRRRRRLG